MAKKRVFIISNYKLFGHGLQSLLGAEDQISIVGQQGETAQALAQIRQLRPDVVIFDSDAPPIDYTPIILQILKELSGTRVVGLNLENNKLFIYQSRNWRITSVDDFIAAIGAD